MKNKHVKNTRISYDDSMKLLKELAESKQICKLRFDISATFVTQEGEVYISLNKSGGNISFPKYGNKRFETYDDLKKLIETKGKYDPLGDPNIKTGLSRSRIVEHVRDQKDKGVYNWRFSNHSAYLVCGASDVTLDWSDNHNYAALHFPYNPNIYYVKDTLELDELLANKERFSWPCKLGSNIFPNSEYAQVRQLAEKRILIDQQISFITNYFFKLAREYTAKYADFHFKSVVYKHQKQVHHLASYTYGDEIITINKSIFQYCLSETQIREVILHELCHSVYMSHGKRFWALLNERVKTEKLTEISWYHPSLFNTPKKEISNIKIPI